MSLVSLVVGDLTQHPDPRGGLSGVQRQNGMTAARKKKKYCAVCCAANVSKNARFREKSLSLSTRSSSFLKEEEEEKEKEKEET